jgi:Domain of unknown function (DUF4437)
LRDASVHAIDHNDCQTEQSVMPKFNANSRVFETFFVLAVMCLLAGGGAADIAGAQQKTTNRYVPADRLRWHKESPNIPIELAALWGDREKGEAGTLLTAPPGFDSGLHSHTADYWAVVVQGAWRHWVPSTREGVGLTFEPGAHWTQVHTQLHQDACVSKAPCIIFLFNKDPYVTHFPKQQGK